MGIADKIETGRRGADPGLLVASAARARAELGLSREFNDHSDIVETAWCCFSRQSVPIAGYRVHRDKGKVGCWY
jgi:UDP-glucose 4-epimerase